jgi:hypothetical protein
MPWFAAALPVQPGQEAEARKRGEGFQRFLAEYLQLSSKLERRFTDSEYDRWWVTHVREVHGFDVSRTPPAPKVIFVHEWKAPGVS